MKKFARCIVILAITLARQIVFSQCIPLPILTVQNPSFEGGIGVGVTPTPWTQCMPGQTPDTQPGLFGIFLPPTDGNSYIGLIHWPNVNPPDGWREGVSEPLSGAMTAGVPYTFTIDLANVQQADLLSSGIIPGCAECEVWGGFGPCDDDNGTGELLWSSGNIMPYDTWQTRIVSFTPTQNFTWITIRVNSLGCTNGPYILVDNMGPIMPGNVSVINTTQQNITCAGASNGTATVHAQGTYLPFTYLWNTSPVQTDSTITGVAAGTYIVTVTDANNCTATDTVVITQPLPVAVAPTVNNVICFGTNTGSIASNPSGGTGAYTYTWSTSPIQTATTATNLSVGSYTVTVRDANNCSASASATVSQPMQLTTTVSPTNILCNGASTGSVTASPAGGAGSYTYTWNTSPIQTTATATNLSFGNYTVTVRDANNCSVSASATVTQPPALSVSATKTNVLCNGGNTGTATAVPTGGTTSYSYSWNTTPAQATPTATYLPIGNYTVTVTDANSCTASASVTINQPTALSVTVSATDILCFGANTGTATATPAGGTTSYSYTWNTTPVQTTPIATSLTAGGYTVVVTDANSCTASASVTINQPTALSVTASATDILCFGANTGTATATPTGGTTNYSYTWNTIPVQTTPIATSLTEGDYTVVVTDANSCTASASATVSQPTQLIVTVSSTDILCFGESNGTATAISAGGTPNYSYEWNTTPVQTTPALSSLTAGNYTVVVTDANSCTASASATINEPALLAVTTSSTDVLCYANSTGIATATPSGGTTNYTYSWNTTPTQTTPTATNLPAGTYMVVVTDANSCTASASATINEPTLLTVAVSSTDVRCYGDSTGSATAAPSGGTTTYSYSWNTTPTQITPTATNLPAGNYDVIVTDANSCSVTASVVINQPLSPLSLSETHTDILCYGESNGDVTVTAIGGTTNYSYEWNTTPAQTTPSITSLIAGTYTATVTDANNCTASISSIINQPALPLSVTDSLAAPICFGQSNASATALVTGGAPNYSYSWNTTPAQTTPTAINLPEGNYTVVVTDTNNCTASASVAVVMPTELELATLVTDVLCYGDSSGSATVNASGSYGNYVYIWNTIPSQYSATSTQLTAGDYSVTVTDVGGCSASASVTVSQPTAALSIAVLKTDILCFGDASGSASVTAMGGTGAYTYVWNTTPPQITDSINNLMAGTYFVTVTDANACSLTASETINQPTQLNATHFSEDVSCYGANDGNISVIVSGGVPVYSYQWSATPSIDSSALTGLSTDAYSVTITDANNCSISIGNIIITEPGMLVLNPIVTDVSCPNHNDGSIDVNPSGGTPGYTFSWNVADSTQVISSISGGNYLVTVTDQNNCSATASIDVIELPGLSLSATSVNIFCYPLANGAIDITASSMFPPLQYEWNSGVTSEDLSQLDTGTYSITVTDAHGCTADSVFYISIDNTYAVDATPDVSNIDLGENVTLNVVATAGSTSGTALWTPSYGLDCTDCINPVASPVENITYHVTFTDVNGCVASDSVRINVNPNYVIFIPNVFTPNNDGNNDYFEVFGNKQAWKHFSVQLFDRWGEKVYESNDINFKWNGEFKGNLLEPTVLVYVIKLVYLNNYTDKIYKGSVTLIR